MTSKLEEIARAIWSIAPDGGRTLLPFSAHPEAERCRAQARAAVAAMREPTEDMHVAPRQLHDKILFVSEIWQAMIDTILNEKESP